MIGSFQNILHHEKNASIALKLFFDIKLNYRNLNTHKKRKNVWIIKCSIYKKLDQSNPGLFFAKIVNVLRSFAIFTEELLRGCFTGFYMRLCPITYYSSKKVWGEISTTGVTQGNLGLPLPPNSPWVTPETKTLETFHFPEAVQCSQIPQPSPRITSTSNRTKQPPLA